MIKSLKSFVSNESGATAIEYGCVLVTDNRKDFDIPGIDSLPV